MARLVTLAIVGVVLAGASAQAQVCHTSGSDTGAPAAAVVGSVAAAPPAITAKAGVEAGVAQIDSGTYAGVTPSLTVAWWRLEARVATPYYHLEYRGVKSDGPGDVMASLSGAVIARAHLRAGAALALTAATGNEHLGLGMGEAMYMPGGWASWSDGAWTALASASYGWMASTSATGGHHHGPGDIGSLVSPMNHEELEGAVRATFRATDELRVYVASSIAAPIGDGTTRAFGATGARVELGATELSLEAALPIAGDPFRGRMTLGVVRTF